MKRWFAALILALAVTGCGAIAPVQKPSAISEIAVIDAFWEQRRDSVPDIPDDFGQRPGTPSGEVPSDAAVDVTEYVHRISLNGGSFIGSAVSLGNGVYVTAKHLFTDRDRNLIKVRDIAIDEHPVTAEWTLDSAKDVAVVKTDHETPGCPLSSTVPEVGDRVVLYGLTTKEKAQGSVLDVNGTDIQVRVDPAYSGITFGDSGGGGFTDQGEVFGVIAAFYADQGVTDHRHVWISRLPDLTEVALQASAGESPEVNYPRLILFTDPSWCGGCRVQDKHLAALKEWDKKGYWTAGPEESNRIQILDDENKLAEKYGVEAIPCWVNLHADGSFEVEVKVKTKEQIVKFCRERG